MGLVGIEPTTFPMSSGRSSQLLNPTVAFHPFDFTFSSARFRAAGELFGVDKLPGTAILNGESSVVIVLGNTLGQICRVADVEATSRDAAEDVHVIRHEQ